MKRVLLFVAALAIVAAPIAAQTAKVDKAAVQKKVAKSDADVANPKKNTKPGVWLERGKAYFEAADAYQKELFRGVDATTLNLLLGKGESGTKTVGDATYETFTYEGLVIYVLDGKVVAWEVTSEIVPDALTTSYDSYTKAYEVDAKSAPKVKDGITGIANYYKQKAENMFAIHKYGESADAFHEAYVVQRHPAVNVIDTASIYNAGFLNTFAHKFDKALEDLKIALDYKNEAGGDIYYYMFHCYYGMNDPANAKQILLDGIAKYPGNTKIVEGLLGIYSTTDGDPKEIIPIVEQSIANEPDNIELWSGLGRIYDKLGDEDKSIEAFAHAAELAPNEFSTNFNLGFLYIKKGDAMNKELNETPPTGQAAYNEGLAKVNAVYAQSLPWLEKAHSIEPENPVAIELLKNVTFRLRDEEGVMQKYEKYDALFKQMKN